MRKKVLAIDLDNTIWSGVLGDEGIEITDAFKRFQEALVDLQYSGVLLVILSKNNEELVLDTIMKHPDMVLELEDFVAIRCNWKPKPENLRSIAEELNLGLDSFVFFDDSLFERMMMREMLPEVTTLTVPSKPEHFVVALENYDGFDWMNLTGDDLYKTEKYHTFKELRKQADDLSTDNFLEGLEMVATIERLTGDSKVSSFNRAHQLLDKTNQFNLNGIRYTPEELRGLMDTHQVYTISLKDSWGDSGIIGVIIWHEGRFTWTVTSFVLSCRVLGRTVEHAIAYWLAYKSNTGYTFKYKETDRNAPVGEFLDALWHNKFVTVEEK
jgi:FkbH-like protein